MAIQFSQARSLCVPGHVRLLGGIMSSLQNLDAVNIRLEYRGPGTLVGGVLGGRRQT